jgi:hypothetical protein
MVNTVERGRVAVAIFISCLIIGLALLAAAWLVQRRYFPPDT